MRNVTPPPSPAASATMLDHRRGRLGLVSAPTSAAEAFERGGLGWNVETVPAFHETAEGMTPVPGRRVIRRVDTLEPLGVVSSQYVPISNAEIAETLDSAVGSIRETLPETVGGVVAAGSWGGGRRVWARLDFGGVDIGGDPIARHAIVYAAHDGGAALRIVPTTVRIFCTNQIAALARSGAGVSIRHSGDSGRALADAVRMIRDSAASVGGILDRLRNLAAAPADPSWTAEYFHRQAWAMLSPRARAVIASVDSAHYGGRLAPNATERAERARARLAATVEDFAERFARMADDADAAAIPSAIRGSRYHALQAVTESLEWGSRAAESRDIGENANRKSAALAAALN